MKKAAGVSDIDEVVLRFSTQGKTSEILGDQMTKAENDVRVLGESKENLQKEWEVVRFINRVRIPEYSLKPLFQIPGTR